MGNQYNDNIPGVSSYGGGVGNVYGTSNNPMPATPNYYGGNTGYGAPNYGYSPPANYNPTPAYYNPASSALSSQLMGYLQGNPNMGAMQAYGLGQSQYGLNTGYTQGYYGMPAAQSAFGSIYGAMQPSIQAQQPYGGMQGYGQQGYMGNQPGANGYQAPNSGFGAGFGSLNEQPSFGGLPGGSNSGLMPAGTPQIHPPNVGEGGLMGPNGRSVQEIAGTPYQSEEERRFYLENYGGPNPLGGSPGQGRTGAPTQTPPSGGGTTLSPEDQQFVNQQRGQPYASDADRSRYLSLTGGTPTPAQPAAGGARTGANWGAWGELPGGQMAPWAAAHGYTPDQIIYQGQNVFNPQVEGLRALVGQFFQPQDVNHALWIIQRESGGNNIPQIGGGPGTGYFQIEHGGVWPGRPSQQALLNPSTNIQYGAGMVYGR